MRINFENPMQGIQQAADMKIQAERAAMSGNVGIAQQYDAYADTILRKLLPSPKGYASRNPQVQRLLAQRQKMMEQLSNIVSKEATPDFWTKFWAFVKKDPKWLIGGATLGAAVGLSSIPLGFKDYKDIKDKMGKVDSKIKDAAEKYLKDKAEMEASIKAAAGESMGIAGSGIANLGATAGDSIGGLIRAFGGPDTRGQMYLPGASAEDRKKLSEYIDAKPKMKQAKMLGIGLGVAGAGLAIGGLIYSIMKTKETKNGRNDRNLTRRSTAQIAALLPPRAYDLYEQIQDIDDEINDLLKQEGGR